jgi:hypothetical protein
MGGGGVGIPNEKTTKKRVGLFQYYSLNGIGKGREKLLDQNLFWQVTVNPLDKFKENAVS